MIVSLHCTHAAKWAEKARSALKRPSENNDHLLNLRVDAQPSCQNSLILAVMYHLLLRVAEGEFEEAEQDTHDWNRKLG